MNGSFFPAPFHSHQFSAWQKKKKSSFIGLKHLKSRSMCMWEKTLQPSYFMLATIQPAYSTNFTNSNTTIVFHIPTRTIKSFYRSDDETATSACAEFGSDFYGILYFKHLNAKLRLLPEKRLIVSWIKLSESFSRSSPSICIRKFTNCLVGRSRNNHIAS